MGKNKVKWKTPRYPLAVTPEWCASALFRDSADRELMTSWAKTLTLAAESFHEWSSVSECALRRAKKRVARQLPAEYERALRDGHCPVSYVCGQLRNFGNWDAWLDSLKRNR